MINKKKSNLAGLKKNREDLKQRNTSAMLQIIQCLHSEKPNSLWTYKEVWLGANLKSNVALDSPWNKHIREAIEAHNSFVRERQELGFLAISKKETLKSTNKDLRSQLEIMRKARDDALSQVAIWVADVEYYKKQNNSLSNIIARLQNPITKNT
ncbi:hypothetical protein [Pseudomonas fragi]|uniref:hypothetical protein n=1 Tax=Pseudomonas fragi TaxID=296 RepID=UPI00147643FD|nr:hypothetical protein [Pseudomonas fragi]NNB52788.1 hypothetical protein [Pseudomonas fragi]